jgi:putative SOS response-associated peptidase YedK
MASLWYAIDRMCYSAMVESQFWHYVRETGAEIDLDQFEEIFGWRDRDPGLRILRAVDRWFDDPKSDGERRIAALIAKYTSEQVPRLEKEIFALRKRLADAGRKLADKPTKKAANDQRIAASKLKKAMRDLALFTGSQPSPLDARTFAFRYTPIVVHAGGRNVVRLARYHLRRPGDSPAEDFRKPGLYNARRDNLERYWRNQFGHTHALLLMESFFEWVDREDGTKAELHFRPQTRGPMYVACLYAEWLGEDGAKLPCFAVITDEPPPEVASAGHNRCPINLTPVAAQRWLEPAGRSSAELQALLDERQRPYYEHEVLAA